MQHSWWRVYTTSVMGYSAFGRAQSCGVTTDCFFLNSALLALVLKKCKKRKRKRGTIFLFFFVIKNFFVLGSRAHTSAAAAKENAGRAGAGLGWLPSLFSSCPFQANSLFVFSHNPSTHALAEQCAVGQYIKGVFVLKHIQKNDEAHGDIRVRRAPRRGVASCGGYVPLYHL